MAANTKKFSVLQVTEQGRSKTYSTVAIEFLLKIILNDRELVTLLCSPTDLEYLAAGFVQSQRLINSKSDIKNIVIAPPDTVRIETKKKVDVPSRFVLASSGGKSTASLDTAKAKTESTIKLPAALIFSVMDDLEQRSKTFKTTGGVHSAALCDAQGIMVYGEDIGRHNAIDKVFGQCLLQNIVTDNCFFLTSGRVSSEILLKVATRGISILIAKNAPTDLGIKLAKDLGITLVGFARGNNMIIYANDWRIES